MDTLRDPEPDSAEPFLPVEARLCAVMEQSDRDFASGLTVPLADVLAELDEAASAAEARRNARPA